MKFSHKVALTAASLGLAAASIAPAITHAQSVNANGNAQAQTQVNPFSSFIQALATRFNLSVSDLESFFQQNLPRPSEDRSNGPTGQRIGIQSQANIEARLTSDVASGKITAAQKTAILAKAQEAKAKHEEARKLSREDCKKMMDAYRTELEAWATQNGIDRSYLRIIMGPKPMGMRGMNLHLGLFGQGSIEQR